VPTAAEICSKAGSLVAHDVVEINPIALHLINADAAPQP
jgi:hypothetical protein